MKGWDEVVTGSGSMQEPANRAAMDVEKPQHADLDREGDGREGGNGEEGRGAIFGKRTKGFRHANKPAMWSMPPLPSSSLSATLVPMV